MRAVAPAGIVTRQGTALGLSADVRIALLAVWRCHDARSLAGGTV